jgi:PIN domain nuclease of toxin-antitoxin system
MPPEVLIASAFLPGSPPRDPADRIIAATARAFGLALITRDGELMAYGESGHLITIAC